jgi:hypothetical protein
VSDPAARIHPSAASRRGRQAIAKTGRPEIGLVSSPVWTKPVEPEGANVTAR